jgi:DNA-binding beta-propeller fold protein YncE
VLGEQLALRQVIASGGTFPVSITEHNGVVYVLNAEEGGALQGIAVSGGRLVQLPDSNRSLGLNPAETPQFTHTPGQVAFSPDGSQLIVTTKANGSDIDVFHVGAFGRLAKAPVVNSEPGAVPFAVAFDQQGDLLVTEAGTNAVASFELHEDGTLAQLDVVPTGEAATCWIARAGSHFYASNAGSGTLSAYRSSAGGQLLTPLGNTPTDGGTVDATVTSSGHFLYVQAGAAGIVDEYAVGAQGALSEVGSVTVPGAAGGEGIVAG